MAAEPKHLIRSWPSTRHVGRVGPRLRQPITLWATLLFAGLAILLVFGFWWFLTRGEAEERIVGPLALPSPRETFAEFHSLWVERALARNTVVTLIRVVLGFALAIAVGVPLGILAGCFSSVRAFLSPLVIFGRNIPLAALIPLTFFLFRDRRMAEGHVHLRRPVSPLWWRM